MMVTVNLFWTQERRMIPNQFGGGDIILRQLTQNPVNPSLRGKTTLKAVSKVVRTLAENVAVVKRNFRFSSKITATVIETTTFVKLSDRGLETHPPLPSRLVVPNMVNRQPNHEIEPTS
jgi:hypothetical protein